MGLVDGRPAFFFGHGSHNTAADHIDVGNFMVFPEQEPFFPEFTGYGRGFGEVYLATEMVKGYSGLSHGAKVANTDIPSVIHSRLKILLQ